MYHLTVTSVRSFMHVTRADHVQTKRNSFSTYIYTCIYVWTINNRKDGNNTVRNYTLVGQSDAFGDPRTSSTPDIHVQKSHVLSGCLHFVWTEPCWKQYILEFEEKRKKPTDPKHASYVVYYIYFSCKYNFVFKLVRRVISGVFFLVRINKMDYDWVKYSVY